MLAKLPDEHAIRAIQLDVELEPKQPASPTRDPAPTPPLGRRRLSATLSLSVEIGLLLALATAFASVLGFLYKHRGAVESPAVEMSRPVRSSLRAVSLALPTRSGS